MAKNTRRTLRSFTREKVRRSSWAFLPPEIRRMVLDVISRQKGWGTCTAVCKEWQVFIATKNLSRLDLHSTAVEGLQTVIRQRNLIKHICLNVELPRYTCRACKSNWGLGSDITRILKAAMRNLFTILSTWESTNCLTLELNAYSPSDSEHWFKNHLFGFEHEDEGDSTQEQKAWHDPDHGWFHGQQVEAPRTEAILRLFKCFLLDPGCLPEVQAIKRLVICRQMRRSVHPVSLQILMRKLPLLESIVYEPWRVWKIYNREGYDTITIRLLKSLVLEHVRSISIFEDFNEEIMAALRADKSSYWDDEFYDINTTRTTSFDVGKAFASGSCSLEHLSVSYMIDARHFFDSCRPSYTWPHLRSLILTAPILTWENRKQRILKLLTSAGEVALRMPQLECMALWYSQELRASAAIFQRAQERMPSTLTWRSTWNLEFNQEVVESWQKVVGNPHNLLVINERVEGSIFSHGDAIHYLRLPDGVIDPTSLQQIRREGLMQRGPIQQMDN